MPRYFFHLSFGAQACHDDEGVDLPNRAAARAEAFAVLRDLTRGRSEKNARGWVGWFLHVADAKGQFFSLPLGERLLSIASEPVDPKPSPARSLDGQLAEVTRSFVKATQNTAHLMQQNRRLREALALELERSTQISSVARDLLSGTRSARLESLGVADLRDAARRRPARSRPQLVVLEGGGRR
jgi:hypothetical protein